MATNGWNCATPLRNPYVTDVVYAPFLLPGAFSTSFTHWQLSELFSAHNLAASNASDYSSEILYQQLLADVLYNTKPVDLVELPRSTLASPLAHPWASQ